MLRKRLVDHELVPVDNASMSRPAAEVAGAFRRHGPR
jgi:hypothetical protein